MTIVTSNFNQANSTTVGPGSFTEVTGDWQTVSNQLKLLSVGTTSRLRFESDTGATDMYAQLTIPDLILTSDVFVAVCARFDAASSSFYYFGRGKNAGFASGYYTLGKSESGVTTVLVAATSFAHSSGETIKITCQGSVIKGFVGGTVKATVTDTSIVVGTRGGVRGYRDVAGDDFTVDNLEAGDLGIAYSLMPTHRPAVFAPMGPNPPEFGRRF